MLTLFDTCSDYQRGPKCTSVNEIAIRPTATSASATIWYIIYIFEMNNFGVGLLAVTKLAGVVVLRLDIR
jgi:hypothetical protein